MDRHTSINASPEEVAQAHLQDLQAQEKYGVRYHTYWYDDDQHSLFCLAEGPSKDAIEAVHATAHGVLADSILEIDPSTPLNEMLGPLPAHPPGEPYTASAMRAIVFTAIGGSARTELDDDGRLALLHDHNELVRPDLTHYDGREVKHTGDGIMASFVSVSAAVAFAIAVQAKVSQRNEDASIPFHMKIGVSAGEPVTDNSEDLFGAAVELAARLCDAARAGDVLVSTAVRELCVGKQFRFDDLGAIQLKGLADSTHVYSVILTGERQQLDATRRLTTVLFTDIVGSTERAAELGDKRWADLLKAHHEVVRSELKRFGGEEVDTAGDGFFATFDGTARAVRCACAIRDSVGTLGLQVRAGVHTGEVDTVRENLTGLTVHIGARISAVARPDEVLVSQTVTDLVVGSGLEFADRGRRKLKGVPGTWRLFSVAD